MKKIKFSHLNSDEKKQITVLSIVVVLTGIILFGSSYAWFVVNVSNQKTTRLVAGTLDLTFDDTDGGEINLTDEVPRSDEEGLQTKGYTFKVKNVGNIKSNYSIYLDDVDLVNGERRLEDQYVKYSLTRDNIVIETDFVSNLTANILESNTIDIDKTSTYTLRLWVDENNFDSNATNKVLKKKLRIEAIQMTNENIIKAYIYNQTKGASNYCITGEEPTCQETACYSAREVGSCKVGTIIQYKVNDTEIVPFHVMFDKGETITMQSQKNTLSNIEWMTQEDFVKSGGREDDYLTSGNTLGPKTALNALENETMGWSNVNNQNYSIGDEKTALGYSGCNLGGCTDEIYNISKQSVKARMITFQEASKLGCAFVISAPTCPIWMGNYLKNSISYGGTANNGNVDRYWTMSAYAAELFNAYDIRDNFNLSTYNMYRINNGAAVRAVVEISK